MNPLIPPSICTDTTTAAAPWWPHHCCPCHLSCSLGAGPSRIPQGATAPGPRTPGRQVYCPKRQASDLWEDLEAAGIDIDNNCHDRVNARLVEAVIQPLLRQVVVACSNSASRSGHCCCCFCLHQQCVLVLHLEALLLSLSLSFLLAPTAHPASDPG